MARLNGLAAKSESQPAKLMPGITREASGCIGHWEAYDVFFTPRLAERPVLTTRVCICAHPCVGTRGCLSLADFAGQEKLLRSRRVSRCGVYTPDKCSGARHLQRVHGAARTQRSTYRPGQQPPQYSRRAVREA